eukprot:1565830-Pleurochrysis_carterae.AAC.1
MSEGSFRRVVMVRWTPCPLSCSAELATSSVGTNLTASIGRGRSKRDRERCRSRPHVQVVEVSRLSK